MPINFQGHTVFQIFQKELESTAKFTIRFVKYRREFIQGLRIRVEGTELEVAGQKLKDIVLWTDTSPTEVEIYCRSKPNARLKMWNVWKYDELMQAWINNAGMLISEQKNRVTLSCSDGIGAPDFSDLIVEIEWASTL